MITAAPSHHLPSLHPLAPFPVPAGSALNHLDVSTLQPRLHPRTWRDRIRLSDDGFCDCPVSINLSRSLAMGLVAGSSTLSHRALAELRLGTRAAWDLAADNLVVAARSPLGTRFYLRQAMETGLISVPAAIQVKVPGAPVTSWLAHPRTFTILNRHLEDRLGPELTYLAPLPDLLIVLPADDTADPEPAARVLSDKVCGPGRSAGELISTVALDYRLGFPTPRITGIRVTQSQVA